MTGLRKAENAILKSMQDYDSRKKLIPIGDSKQHSYFEGIIKGLWLALDVVRDQEDE